MAAGIWVKLIRKNRIEMDIALDCNRKDWLETLEQACHALDVGKPMVLPRHERDWDQFSQVRFLKDHFIENVPFDRMEVEYIDPDRKKKNGGAGDSFR